MPGLYQYLELSWTNLALTLMSTSSLDCVEPRLCSAAAAGEKETWCVGDGAEETLRTELCPFRDPAVEDKRFFSGSGGCTAGMVTAV